jgi:hypothetical protein
VGIHHGRYLERHETSLRIDTSILVPQVPKALAAPPKGSETLCGQVAVGLRMAGWTEFLIPTMVAISAVESGCRVDAELLNDVEWSLGPLQINLSAHPWVGEWCAKDYVCSARAALRIFHMQGLRAWSSYRNGMYMDALR